MYIFFRIIDELAFTKRHFMFSVYLLWVIETSLKHLGCEKGTKQHKP